MKRGPGRFKYFLAKLEQLLIDASRQEDPAFWLYENNARTPLFMLEGLGRLYSGLHDDDIFRKMERRFKELEDVLGAIDYYDGFAKDFASDETISPEVTAFARVKMSTKVKDLSKSLDKGGWLDPHAKRLDKIRKQLGRVSWLGEEREMNAIRDEYEASVSQINQFQKKYARGFTELEGQVHELRRRLRWLSIYPQALQGAVQFTEAPSGDPCVAKYLTPEIVNSPYNKMPAPGTIRFTLLLNKDYFLALSWMIDQLGKLKDEGLRQALLAEAGAIPAADNTALLERCTAVTATYFSEGDLDKLVSGVAARH